MLMFLQKGPKAKLWQKQNLGSWDNFKKCHLFISDRPGGFGEYDVLHDYK